MTKFASSAALFCASAMFLGGVAQSHACSEVRVNGTDGWYPVVMRSADGGSFEGLMPQIADKAFASLDVPVSVQPNVPWNRLFVQLDRAELDVLMGVYWTEERDQAYVYSAPVIEDEVAVFVPVGKEFELGKLEDLAGKTGMRPFGGSYGEEFDKYAEANLDIRNIKDETGLEILNLLSEGKADYAVLGRYDGLKAVQEMGLQGKITDLAFPVASNSVYFLFSKTSDCAGLVPDFDAQLQAMKDGGQIEGLVSEYRLQN